MKRQSSFLERSFSLNTSLRSSPESESKTEYGPIPYRYLRYHGEAREKDQHSHDIDRLSRSGISKERLEEIFDIKIPGINREIFKRNIVPLMFPFKRTSGTNLYDFVTNRQWQINLAEQISYNKKIVEEAQDLKDLKQKLNEALKTEKFAQFTSTDNPVKITQNILHDFILELEAKGLPFNWIKYACECQLDLILGQAKALPKLKRGIFFIRGQKALNNFDVEKDLFLQTPSHVVDQIKDWLKASQSVASSAPAVKRSAELLPIEQAVAIQSQLQESFDDQNGLAKRGTIHQITKLASGQGLNYAERNPSNREFKTDFGKDKYENGIEFKDRDENEIIFSAAQADFMTRFEAALAYDKGKLFVGPLFGSKQRRPGMAVLMADTGEGKSFIAEQIKKYGPPPGKKVGVAGITEIVSLNLSNHKDLLQDSHDSSRGRKVFVIDEAFFAASENRQTEGKEPFDRKKFWQLVRAKQKASHVVVYIGASDSIVTHQFKESQINDKIIVATEELEDVQKRKRENLAEQKSIEEKTQEIEWLFRYLDPERRVEQLRGKDRDARQVAGTSYMSGFIENLENLKETDERFTECLEDLRVVAPAIMEYCTSKTLSAKNPEVAGSKEASSLATLLKKRGVRMPEKSVESGLEVFEEYCKASGIFEILNEVVFSKLGGRSFDLDEEIEDLSDQEQEKQNECNKLKDKRNEVLRRIYDLQERHAKLKAFVEDDQRAGFDKLEEAGALENSPLNLNSAMLDKLRNIESRTNAALILPGNVQNIPDLWKENRDGLMQDIRNIFRVSQVSNIIFPPDENGNHYVFSSGKEEPQQFTSEELKSSRLQGSTICIYDKSNYIGGDYADYSLRVSRAVIALSDYSHIGLDDLKQMVGRPREKTDDFRAEILVDERVGIANREGLIAAAEIDTYRKHHKDAGEKMLVKVAENCFEEKAAEKFIDKFYENKAAIQSFRIGDLNDESFLEEFFYQGLREDKVKEFRRDIEKAILSLDIGMSERDVEHEATPILPWKYNLRHLNQFLKSQEDSEELKNKIILVPISSLKEEVKYRAFRCNQYGNLLNFHSTEFSDSHVFNEEEVVKLSEKEDCRKFELTLETRQEWERAEKGERDLRNQQQTVSKTIQSAVRRTLARNEYVGEIGEKEEATTKLESVFQRQKSRKDFGEQIVAANKLEAVARAKNVNQKFKEIRKAVKALTPFMQRVDALQVNKEKIEGLREKQLEEERVEKQKLEEAIQRERVIQERIEKAKQREIEQLAAALKLEEDAKREKAVQEEQRREQERQIAKIKEEEEKRYQDELRAAAIKERQQRLEEEERRRAVEMQAAAIIAEQQSLEREIEEAEKIRTELVSREGGVIVRSNPRLESREKSETESPRSSSSSSDGSYVLQEESDLLSTDSERNSPDNVFPSSLSRLNRSFRALISDQNKSNATQILGREMSRSPNREEPSPHDIWHIKPDNKFDNLSLVMPGVSCAPISVRKLGSEEEIVNIDNIWRHDVRQNKFRIDNQSHQIQHQQGEQVGILNSSFEISQIETSTKERIENLFLDVITLAAANRDLTYNQVLEAIQSAKEKGGIRNKITGEGNEEAKEEVKKYGKFSGDFQKLTKALGIYSGREDGQLKIKTDGSPVGLRLTFLPDSVVKKLEEIKDRFEDQGKVKSEIKEELNNRINRSENSRGR